MIVAKQMIKTNQILSVGWSLSVGKIREKLRTNQQPSLKRYVRCAIQSENQQNEHRQMKNHPKPRDLRLLWKLSNKNPCPSFLHVKTVHVCRLLRRQVDFLQYYSTQDSNQMNVGYQSSWNEEGRMCARSCNTWVEFNNYKSLKRNTLTILVTQIMSRRQKNADVKVLYSISRRQFSKKFLFPNIQLKGVVNRLPPFKKLSDHTNRSLMG